MSETVVVKTERKTSAMVPYLIQTEHKLTLDELADTCKVKFNPAKPVSSAGLSASEALDRLLKNGPNILTPAKTVHPIIQFLKYLLGIFNVMLLVSGIACYILFAIDPVANFSNVYIGGILLAVGFINAGIEFYQVRKSQAILESFLNLIPAKCYVIRDSATVQISGRDLVYGDVVYVRSGDKIPADLVVFAATDLKVDNSSLTGETDPQERVVTNKQENPLEATNILFNGTLCVNGEGYGIVVKTGDTTMIGQIASMTNSEERRNSPMSEEIENFVNIIASVAAIVAIIFFLISLLVKNPGNVSLAINFAIATFISFVPEGLPATVTILLTLAAKRMSTRNVLVKDLQGVETLGAITLLATDKTGTLTRNKMTVTYLWTGEKMFFAQSQSSTEAQYAVELDMSHEGVNEVTHMCALSTRARFETMEGPISDRHVLGDATEAGLLRNAAIKLKDFEKLNDMYPKVFEIPFNSTNKWAMTIHKKKHSNGQLMLYLKGAPERVLKLCSTYFDGQKAVPMSDSYHAGFEKTYNFMASKGHRVLAFAALQLPGDAYPENFEFKKDPINYPTNDLTFYGLVSLEDPPKHGVREAIGHCREAGIKVMMVTGDHPLTAEAIGRKINLMLQDTKPEIARKRNCNPSEVHENDVHAIVIHGEEIDDLTEEQWDNIFSKDEIIFARTSPKHKLQIVKHAQSKGHIVGVTGDGVNDSPALKKADLGIAMNESGSDVSKEAAAMILLDDNFASTVNGIEEGRLIFQNLKKSIQYTVTHTMPEVYANLLFIAVPIPLPLTALLIIFTDLGFEMIMSLSYAYDPPESRGLMKLQPRKPVTAKSMALLKKIAEENEVRKPFLSLPVTSMPAELWRRCQKTVSSLFEEKEEETLVDGGLLQWAYIEAGTIQTIGCLVAYFFALYFSCKVTPSQVADPTIWALSGAYPRTEFIIDKDTKEECERIGQSAYYISLMIMQGFNLFICKARMGLPVGKFMFANLYSFYGLLGGALFTFFIVYFPYTNVAFGTSYKLTPYVWLIAFGFGIVLFGYSIIRTIIERSRNPLKYSQKVEGLDLHPTRWSTGR